MSINTDKIKQLNYVELNNLLSLLAAKKKNLEQFYKLSDIGVNMSKEDIEKNQKLDKLYFLIINHIDDIVDSFYE